MIEQWFLDLDGVRSGPYQTPEVMSLIAEGEVLPHHRISTSLRDQRWVTILDWRLDQAKISQKIPSVFSSSRSEVSSVEGLTEAPKVVIAPKPEPKSEPVTESTFVESSKAVTPEAPEAAVSMKLSEEKTPGFSPPFEPPKFESPKPSYIPPPPIEPSDKPKRDPMAEMFDVIQHSKQKKQARQIQEASTGVSIEHDHGDATQKSSFGLGRTLAIGLGITLVGFALGQLFQQSTPQQKEPTAPTTSVKPSPSPIAASSPATGETEVVDRSTDKMTIRGLVHKDEQTEDTPAAPAKINSRNLHGNSVTPETPQTEKELEELQNLKKELQELKNLKNTAVDESPDMNDVQGERPDPNGDPNRQDPNSGVDPNAPPTTTYPSEGGPPPTIYNNGDNPNR